MKTPLPCPGCKKPVFTVRSYEPPYYQVTCGAAMFSGFHCLLKPSFGPVVGTEDQAVELWDAWVRAREARGE
jgi:hypothetical protein